MDNSDSETMGYWASLLIKELDAYDMHLGFPRSF